jgi:hypothetical protein
MGAWNWIKKIKNWTDSTNTEEHNREKITTPKDLKQKYYN